jgi:hypothetical protein
LTSAAAADDHDEIRPGAAAHGDAHQDTLMLQREAERRWTRLPEAQRAQRASRAAPATTAGPQPLDQVGRWGALTELDEYAIHASLLPTGRILIFGRQPERSDGTRENVGSALLFDPTGRAEPEWVRPPPVEDTNGDGRVDDRDDPAAIYCAGQSLLADGRVFLAGGNLAEPGEGRPGYSGRVHTFLFDPWTKTWEVGPQMNRGRWYPSQVKLPTGEIAIVSGLDEDGQGTHNPEVEIYRPEAGGAGRLEAMPAGDKELSLYPNLFLLPEGNVLLAGPRDNDSHLLDPTMRGPDRPQNSGWTAFQQQPSVKHMGGAAVLLPRAGAFGGVNEVLLMGGGDSDGGGYELARPTVEHLDAAARPEPAWSHGGADDFNQARFYPNVVLLPDDGMVAVGGGSGTDDRPGGYGNYHLEDPAPTELKRVELRRPGEEGWRLGAAQQEWRTYHSVALLLPDGRVLSAGDDFHEGPDPDQPVPDGVRRDSAEVYTPPYLFDGSQAAPRPQIEDAPARVGHGTTFGVRAPQAGGAPDRRVARAVLVAPAAVTHSVDMNQRVVPLRITETIPGEGVNVVAPPSTAVAPPGYYLLFLVDESGTPSTARWVQVLPGAQGGPPVTAPDPPVKPEPPAEPEPDHSGPTPPPPAPAPSPAPGLAPPTSAVVAPPASSRFPAKLKVRRARVDDGRLDLLLRITGRADGRVKIAYRASGETFDFTARIEDGTIRVDRRIPADQRDIDTGIVTIEYAGNDRVRPTEVHLRAADQRAELERGELSIEDGRLRAEGRIAGRARGLVRLRLGYEDERGEAAFWYGRARIEDGRWRVSAQLPATARGGGYLTIAFTGYLRARGGAMRGEQDAKQVLAGE